MRRAGTAWVVAAVALLLAGITLAISLRGGSQDAVAEDSGTPTGVATVTRRDISAFLTLPGVVSSHEEFDLLAERSGQAVISLAPGERLVRRLVPLAAEVRRGEPVARVVVDGLVVAADVPPESAFRFLNKPAAITAQVDGSSGPQHCQPLGQFGAAPVPASQPGGVALCRLSSDVRAFPGMPAAIQVRFAVRRNVLALPVAAVAGTVDVGLVRVKTADGERLLHVGLGESDETFIEITSGLAAGAKVVLPAPNIIANQGS